MNSTISNINQSNQILEEKIKVAARLELKDFAVSGIFKNGSTKKNNFKNRSLEKIKIDFSLSENDLAKIEVINIFILIKKPDGEIIFDISRGSGSFTFEKRELIYTLKEEILIDKSAKQLSIDYIKNEELKKGVHNVLIYTKDYLIGQGEFLIK